MAKPSQTPVRYLTGVATDPPSGPLGNLGAANPFLYHLWDDDFNVLNADYTKTVSGTGTVAEAAGDGGLILFTTTAVAAEFASIQMPAAGFARAAADAGKKMFFMARLKVSSASLTAFIVGLIQKTATPFTVVDGIYFTKATGSAANITLRSTVGSAHTDVVIPTSAYTLADNTFLTLAWAMDRNGRIEAFVSSDFFNPLTTDPKGAVAAMTPASITTVALTPTLAVQAGTTTVKTMTVDFAMAAKER